MGNELTVQEVQRLEVLESVIDAGMQTFVHVGNALLEIRDSRLYRTTHGTFDEYCQVKWQMGKANANRVIAAAEVAGNLASALAIPSSIRQAFPLASLEPDVQREVWQRAVDTAPNGKVTGPHVQATVNEYRNGGPLPLTAANHAVSADPDYDGDEWYTPTEYIEAARQLMGGIDLDPASSAEAQEIVKAGAYFTKQDDGLSQPWMGCVWLNPPYSTPAIKFFVAKLINEYQIGNVTEAVILTNNSSDTAWFHDLLSRFPACFTRGRVQFWRANHETFGARQGQTLFYLGDNLTGFRDVFSVFGEVVVRV